MKEVCLLCSLLEIIPTVRVVSLLSTLARYCKQKHIFTVLEAQGNPLGFFLVLHKASGCPEWLEEGRSSLGSL